MPINKSISIVGDAYLQPISVLLEKLFLHPGSPEDEVGTGTRTCGYSISICILAFLYFESYTMRIRYLNPKYLSKKYRWNFDFLEKLYKNFPNIDTLKELAVLRDLIVHNHLWEIDFSSDNKFRRKIDGAHKNSFSGDKKYENCVDLKTYKTKILQLNVIPTKIGKSDVCKVLNSIIESLLFIEEKDINVCQISNSIVIFGETGTRRRNFVELISELCPNDVA